MAEYTPEEIEKSKQRFKEIAEQGRTQGDIRKSYHDIPDKPKTGGSGGTGGGMGTGKMNRDISKNMKAGGKVSEVSHKKALKKAGFYDKDKTKSEREKIVSNVTTKPQRLGMVEKLFLAKKMKSGGMASKRADGIAIRGKTKA